ncbi:MAG: Asp-tRNA(Asn)/Glu-tRNA(Gln) amidotransferase subunit GatC [Myxococcota bacterium]
MSQSSSKEPLSVSEQEVRSVAKLAQLSLTEPEVAQLSTELGRILGYMQELATAGVTQVPPTLHPVQDHEGRRKDVCRPSLDRELLLREAPEHVDGGFAVPLVLESE